MAKSLGELQNENKAITKQLSKCVVNESVISKSYEELNIRYEKILEESKQMKYDIQADKIVGIIPKIKSVLDSYKITDKKYQDCQKEKYQYSLDNSTMKKYVVEELLVNYKKEECKDACYPSDFQKFTDEISSDQEAGAFNFDE